jgi:hypothetical protein
MLLMYVMYVAFLAFACCRLLRPADTPLAAAQITVPGGARAGNAGTWYGFVGVRVIRVDVDEHLTVAAAAALPG